MIKSARKLFLMFGFGLLGTFLVAQEDTIYLSNPSFEGVAQAGQRGISFANGWEDCGKYAFPKETPPDIHPNEIDPLFGVKTSAQHGDTYLGLVVRDNDTWESVSQRLSAPMQAGNCYNFSLYLARSADYQSALGERDSSIPEKRNPDEIVNHNTPVTLRIWGGNGYCDKGEELGVTSEIVHERWIEYKYKFEPKSTIAYLTLEVFPKMPNPFPINGNLLIDNLSAIVPTPCQEEPPMITFSSPKKNGAKVSTSDYTFRAKTNHILKKDQLVIRWNNQLVENFGFDARTGRLTVPRQLKKGRNTIIVRGKNSAGNVEARRTVTYEDNPVIAEIPPTITDPTPSKPSILKRSDLKAGKTIRIEKLYFSADSSAIKMESYGALNEVFDFLNQNPDVVVEIGGHTNNVPSPEYCFRLSKARAKAVKEYLVGKGISTERLYYRGYGKTKPIASNRTKDGRIRNQRVEIKILSFNS